MVVTDRDRKYLKETENILRNYKQLKVNIEILEEEKKRLSERIATLPAISYDGARIQSSHSGNPTEDSALCLYYESFDNDAYLSSTKSLVFKIDKSIESLTDIQKEVVRLSLIENESWNKVSDKLNYSERHLRRIRDIAIYRIAIALFGATVLKTCPISGRKTR